jgi:hypothetical protein
MGNSGVGSRPEAARAVTGDTPSVGRAASVAVRRHEVIIARAKCTQDENRLEKRQRAKYGCNALSEPAMSSSAFSNILPSSAHASANLDAK